MADTPTVRDELLDYLAGRFPGHALTPRARGCLVDDVLAWLGDLDPDADPALVAHHLHTSRAHIAQLRQALTDLIDGMENGDMPDLQPLLDAARAVIRDAA